MRNHHGNKCACSYCFIGGGIQHYLYVHTGEITQLGSQFNCSFLLFLKKSSFGLEAEMTSPFDRSVGTTTVSVVLLFTSAIHKAQTTATTQHNQLIFLLLYDLSSYAPLLHFSCHFLMFSSQSFIYCHSFRQMKDASHRLGSLTAS